VPVRSQMMRGIVACLGWWGRWWALALGLCGGETQMKKSRITVAAFLRPALRDVFPNPSPYLKPSLSTNCLHFETKNLGNERQLSILGTVTVLYITSPSRVLLRAYGLPEGVSSQKGHCTKNHHYQLRVYNFKSAF
jgi:hypothetical protein